VVVTVDADGQHTPEDAQRVCAEAETHYAALVLGSRSFSGKVPLRSKLGNTITRGVFRMAAGAAGGRHPDGAPGVFRPVDSRPAGDSRGPVRV
jgi:hypothetical protein